MKALTILALGISISLTGFGQEARKKTLFTIGDHEIGGYVGTALKASSLDKKLAGYVDLKAVAVIDGTWGIGIGASGLYYDRKLTALVPDGTYHFYAGYTGLYLERLFPVSDDLRISVSLLMGQGQAYYQYDNAYRKDKIWYQETIDRTDFSVFEPGFEMTYRFGGNFWLGVAGTYRNTSPLRLIGTSDSALRTFTGGISLKYGVF